MNAVLVFAAAAVGLLRGVAAGTTPLSAGLARVDASGHVQLALDAQAPEEEAAVGGPAVIRRTGAAFERSATEASLLGRGSADAGDNCVPAPVLNPPEQSRVYSSVFRNYPPGSYHARSRLDSPLGWQAMRNHKGESLTIDVATAHQVYGVVTQGRAIDHHPQWVTEFRVQCSIDGKDWTDVDGGRRFQGNWNPDTKVENKFDHSVRARYVKIVVGGWHSHIAMRAGVLVCEPCTPGAMLNPPEENRQYSSIWGYNETSGNFHASSMLGSASAWKPNLNREGEWVTIDLESTKRVRGIRVQGEQIPATPPSWVTKFRVQCAEHLNNFTDVGEEFVGNDDGTAQVTHVFGYPCTARYLRLIVRDWHRSVALRVGVLECLL